MGYVFLAIVILAIAAGLISIFRDIIEFIYWEVYDAAKKVQPLAAKHRDILTKFSAYYTMLGAGDKKLFEKRVQRFMYSKRFIPRGFRPVTAEMRVLISASACQLTFGLPKIYLSHFDKILIYPDTYYSRITRKYHRGEVNPRIRMIILSWKNFVEGYADITDSLNLGIHEMAHAMHLENQIANTEYDFLDKKALEDMVQISTREIARIRAGKGHFLRAYAGTNQYEFFAVSLEHFFEQPLDFRRELPDLYQALSRLLNQDPVRLYQLAGH